MTLQSPTATLKPLFSSSELTGCGYPGLLDRKNRSDMCPRWESNPRLLACKASTLSTRPSSPLSDFCAVRIDVIMNFVVITNVGIERAHCKYALSLTVTVHVHYIHEIQQHQKEKLFLCLKWRIKYRDIFIYFKRISFSITVTWSMSKYCFLSLFAVLFANFLQKKKLNRKKNNKSAYNTTLIFFPTNCVSN